VPKEDHVAVVLLQYRGREISGTLDALLGQLLPLDVIDRGQMGLPLRR
jgi:hypothetical protein